ncbi:MBL fold metallo-hydrolase [Kribbella deserti]|uniref:MBL fold metallo-hydrolase n=1 Tax=Kribbella deserti TaxID=1926257 RepID=A0ABV6QZJ4_9ACTN
MFTLTVLGTAAPYPQPDRPCSGYLLRTENAKVWVDAGPGSMMNLLRHTRLEELDAIWLSHLHADHTLDLVNAYYALSFGLLPKVAPIPVYAPAGMGDRIGGWFLQPGVADEVLELQDLSDGHEVRINDLSLLSKPVKHGTEAYGLRATANGRTLVYSGDCAPSPGLDVLAAGADVLLCEADVDQPSEVHHTPEDAGELARRAGVGRLVVTHVGPALDRVAATKRAAVVFGGPTLTAVENESLTV